MSGKLTWFALYTRVRYEKRVNDDLLKMGYESYLPTQKTFKQLSDRKKWVEVPLFNSYCFVRLAPERYLDPLKINGVVKYIWLEGKPAIVRDREIEALKLICSSDASFEAVELTLTKGQKVCVTSGTLKGLTGEYLKNAGQNKILIRIDSINHGIMVSIPSGFIASC